MPDESYSNKSDQELVQLLKNDDEKAFELIYERYWKKLYTLAFNLLRDPAVCQDLIQDVFYQLWVKRRVHSIASLPPYLFTSVRHAVYKAVKMRKAVIDAASLAESLSTESPALNSLHEKDILGILSETVAALPKKCRQIFLLSREQYLSNHEIAEQLNISPKTVENQLTIALRRLRTSLEVFFSMLILLL